MAPPWTNQNPSGRRLATDVKRLESCWRERPWHCFGDTLPSSPAQPWTHADALWQWRTRVVARMHVVEGILMNRSIVMTHPVPADKSLRATVVRPAVTKLLKVFRKFYVDYFYSTAFVVPARSVLGVTLLSIAVGELLNVAETASLPAISASGCHHNSIRPSTLSPARVHVIAASVEQDEDQGAGCCSGGRGDGMAFGTFNETPGWGEAPDGSRVVAIEPGRSCRQSIVVPFGDGGIAVPSMIRHISCALCCCSMRAWEAPVCSCCP